MGIAADIRAEIAANWFAARAALDWQIDCGVDETIGDIPQDRYDESRRMAEARASERGPAPSGPDMARPQGQGRPQPRPPSPPPVAEAPAGPDPVAVAAEAAARAATLDDLRAAQAGYSHCALRQGARNFVFADGVPGARVLILGEAPGADEDREGRPFVGRAGQLLDRMFAAIGLSRTSPDPDAALYITNVMPWRPPGNRDPEPAEIAMMRPFVERHIQLADPRVIVIMGNTPLFALTGQRGILKARGNWGQALGRPVLPMTHPAYLLRNPAAKREAWADLLMLKARLAAP